MNLRIKKKKACWDGRRKEWEKLGSVSCYICKQINFITDVTAEISITVKIWLIHKWSYNMWWEDTYLKNKNDEDKCSMNFDFFENFYLSLLNMLF